MQKDTNNIPWIEKYRPQKLQDIVHNQNLLDLFKNSVKTTEITHFLFYGPSGTGKTSAIHAIGREIFGEYYHNRVIEFNASDDRGINAVREKITSEAKRYVSSIKNEDGTIIPPYKIIVLDEADSMTDEAQYALRVIIEQFSAVTRFCFICNNISKISDTIKSRCSVVYFKKLSNECMINKLREISINESMELSINIFNTIVDVSNGDMRKAIMVLQNLKYLYNFKNSLKKPFKDMSTSEIKVISSINLNNIKLIDLEIKESDIYDIAATIDVSTAQKFITDALKCKTIREVSNLCKKIISNGYPIDNIISQLNNAVLISSELDDMQKARILTYCGKIILRIKECSNEYIQLLDYLSCVNGIYKGNTAY